MHKSISFAATTMTDKITIMLPYVYHDVTAEFIRSILCHMEVGTISSIDLRPVGDHQQAFVHFENVNPENELIIALNEGQTLEATYDPQGHYWKMVKYVRRGPSPQTRDQVYKMVKEREAREAAAMKASILAQEQLKLNEMIKEIAEEQEHLAKVVAGTADYNYVPTPEEQAAKVQPVIDDLTAVLTRQTLMTDDEKTTLVRKFAAMMFYL